MTATEIRQELENNLRPRLAKLQDERAHHVHKRDVALSVEPRLYSDENVEPARREIARLDAEVINVGERIAALELLMPAAERNDAYVEADALLEQVQSTKAAFEDVWAQLMVQLDAADKAARAVATAKSENRTAVVTLLDWIRRQRLELALPPILTPSRDEMNVAGLIGTVIRDVGFHQVIDDLADRELMTARAKCAQNAR